MARVKEIESEAVVVVDAEIKRLLSEGRWREALEVATTGAAEHPASQLLAKWKDLLTPRRARLAGPASGRSMRREAAWIREHGHEYRGQWLALHGDTLLAVASSLDELREQVRAMGRPEEDLLFHFIPREPWR